MRPAVLILIFTISTLLALSQKLDRVEAQGLFSGLFGGGGGFSFGDLFRSSSDGGTKRPKNTGFDSLNPSDCGRDKKRKGKLCFGDAKLCSERKQKSGAFQVGRRTYYASWQSNDLSQQKWDWFGARNYCRKRCMDLAAFETDEEYNNVISTLLQQGSVETFWTSGRYCDFEDACKKSLAPDRWFWSSNQRRIKRFHNLWSSSSNGPTLTESTVGDNACIIVGNSRDGLKWQTGGCTSQKYPILCEDERGHFNYVQRFYPRVNLNFP